MISVLFLVSLFCALTLHAAPPSADYELLYEDAFNGPINESMWSYREGRRTMGTWINALTFGVKDSTKAGKLGTTESGYEAVGEVMGEFSQPKKCVRSVNFTGQISTVRIYNKAVESR